MRGAACTALALLIVSGLFGGACRQRQEPFADLETEDIGPAVDVDMSTEADVQAERRAAVVAGLVPGDFPRDFPLYAPAALVDFGEMEGGRRFLAFDSPDPPERLKAWLQSEPSAAGWGRLPGGAGSGEFSRRGWRIHWSVEALSGGSRLRLEYHRE